MRKIVACLFVLGIACCAPVAFSTCGGNTANGIGTSPSAPAVSMMVDRSDVVKVDVSADDEQDGIGTSPSAVATDAGPADGIGTSPSGHDPVADPVAYGVEAWNAFKSGAYYIGSVMLLILAVAWARVKGPKIWPVLGSGLAAVIMSVVLGAAGSALAALASGAAAAAVVSAVFAGALKGFEAAGVVRLFQKATEPKA